MVTGVVSDQEKQSFKDLISKINQFEGKETLTEDKLVTSNKTAAAASVALTKSRGSSADVGMQNILNKLNVVFENQKEILKEDQALVVDLNTKPTESGVQVGDWEIVKIIEDKIPSYNIVSLTTKKTILEKVNTYITAKTVIKFLNEGLAINSDNVKKLLTLDEKMEECFQESWNFKVKYKKTGNELYEARSQYAKDRMIAIQKEIKKFSEGVA